MVEIVYKGNSELENDEFKDAVTIKEYELLNMNKSARRSIRCRRSTRTRATSGEGSYHLEDVKAGETVKLIFDIEENEKVKVKKITFIGNKNLPDNKLKSRLFTQEGGFFSFVSG